MLAFLDCLCASECHSLLSVFRASSGLHRKLGVSEPWAPLCFLSQGRNTLCTCPGSSRNFQALLLRWNSGPVDILKVTLTGWQGTMVNMCLACIPSAYVHWISLTKRKLKDKILRIQDCSSLALPKHRALWLWGYLSMKPVLLITAAMKTEGSAADHRSMLTTQRVNDSAGKGIDLISGSRN